MVEDPPAPLEGGAPPKWKKIRTAWINRAFMCEILDTRGPDRWGTIQRAGTDTLLHRGGHSRRQARGPEGAVNTKS